MRSVQQHRGGRRAVVTSPEPLVRPGRLLIQTACSLISAGTEKMLRQLGNRPLSPRVRERPRELRRWLEEIRDEGLLESVLHARLDEPAPLGYSSAGTVLACGAGVQDFRPGDRVASNGAHAEVVCVPRHLCAHVPTTVPFEQAAFTTLGAVALQGVRLSRLVLGETALVVGLGLIGQLTVAILRAAGCQVVGVDPDPHRCRLARGFGAATARPGLAADTVEKLTGGLGVDAVLIASSTYSSAPLRLASKAVRQKGRIVLVGVAGMQLERQPFYYKEAELVVSCSYGPGRHDPRYEELGQDYPAAYVRWTEQRNLQAVLDLMAGGNLDLGPLISHRFDIARAAAAYELIESRREATLGLLLEYPEAPITIPRHRLQISRPTSSPREIRSASQRVGTGVLGTKELARSRLMPRFGRRSGLAPILVCSPDGVSAAASARRFGFAAATSDAAEVFRDSAVAAVFVFSEPREHAVHVLEALRRGQHVFVQEPLCQTLGELTRIERAIREMHEAPRLTIGYHRRFAPATAEVAAFFAEVVEPLAVTVRIHAAPAPENSGDAEVDGGRFVGEAGQAIDLASHLAGAPPARVFAEAAGADEQWFLTLRHTNGSVSSLVLLTGGERRRSRERIEVTGGGRGAVIDDFRTVVLSRDGHRDRRRRRRGRGFRETLDAWTRTLTGDAPPPIPWTEIAAVTRTTLLAVRSLREGVPFEVEESG